MKKIFIRISIVLAVGALLARALPAYAADTGSPELNQWLQDFIDIFTLLVGLVIVISIIIAGIQYMTAGSNSSQVSAAKNRISMAVLALILYIFAFALLQWLVPGGIF